MTLFHERWRRRVSLLASEALEESERASTLAHLEGCAACREELAGLRRLLDLVAADPVREARPEIPLRALVARVQARLDDAEAAPTRPHARPVAAWWPALAATATVVALLALPRSAERPAEPTQAQAQVPQVPPELLQRLEANAAREQAARYLSAAQDVLLTVAATPRDCDRTSGRVDMAAEARRSRELLARRALLELDHAQVAAARPVLDDVERVLRDVAALEACARSQDLALIHREIRERRLLMKIDLMTRELEG
jgi:hypothetical protein